jgi:hypothetical protein
MTAAGAAVQRRKFWSQKVGGRGHYLNSKSEFGVTVLDLVKNHRDLFQVL